MNKAFFLRRLFNRKKKSTTKTTVVETPTTDKVVTKTKVNKPLVKALAGYLDLDKKGTKKELQNRINNKLKGINKDNYTARLTELGLSTEGSKFELLVRVYLAEEQK